MFELLWDHFTCDADCPGGKRVESQLWMKSWKQETETCMDGLARIYRRGQDAKHSVSWANKQQWLTGGTASIDFIWRRAEGWRPDAFNWLHRGEPQHQFNQPNGDRKGGREKVRRRYGRRRGLRKDDKQGGGGRLIEEEGKCRTVGAGLKTLVEPVATSWMDVT